MTDSLKKELQFLLEKYPELNEHRLAFSGNDISLKPIVTIFENDNSEKSRTADDAAANDALSFEVITGNSPKIEMRRSPVHGYGVFAKQDIESGEQIDQCRLLKLGYRSNYNQDPVLKDYVWSGEGKSAESIEHGPYVYLALGFGSAYNHSDKPNTIKENDFRARVMTIKTGSDILKDQEIFVSYGSRYFMVRNFWKNIHKNNTLEKFLKKNQ